MFWIGLIGAAICILYALDTIWVYESGRSLLQISGRFVSREDMLLAVVIGVVLAVLSLGTGVAAQSFLNKSAEERAAAKDQKSCKRVSDVSAFGTN